MGGCLDPARTSAGWGSRAVWAQHSAPAPGPSWPPPARRCREPRGGPLPYLTPCSAALPCPALAGCPAAQRVAKPHCQVAYRDPMALDTNWCRLPRMNNVITGITVKRSHSHSLNAETGPLGPSGEHLLQLCPLPATYPIIAQVVPLAPTTLTQLVWLELLCAGGHQSHGMGRAHQAGGDLQAPHLCAVVRREQARRAWLDCRVPHPGAPSPATCGSATAGSCAVAKARTDVRPRDAPRLGFGTCPRLLCQGHPRTLCCCAGQAHPRQLAACCAHGVPCAQE